MGLSARPLPLNEPPVHKKNFFCTFPLVQSHSTQYSHIVHSTISQYTVQSHSTQYNLTVHSTISQYTVQSHSTQYNLTVHSTILQYKVLSIHHHLQLHQTPAALSLYQSESPQCEVLRLLLLLQSDLHNRGLQ